MLSINKCKTFLLIPLFITAFLFNGCEMEEETEINPTITFNFPQNNQQIYRGAEIKIIAQLKGFSGYLELQNAQLMIDDSVVFESEENIDQIVYLWETASYSEASHSIQINLSYKDNTPEDKDWNYFNARDYIEEESNTENDISPLTLSQSVSVNIESLPAGNPGLSYATLSKDTFNYFGRTIILDAFQISTHEVTTVQYTEFLNAISASTDGTYGNMKYVYLGESSNIKHDGSKFIPKNGTHFLPVTHVTWLGAQNYCRWAGGRLPTITEWYHASSPDYINSTGFILNDDAWFRSNSNGTIQQVGTKNANPHGIYDMLGNVSEWCLDWYSEDPYSGTQDPIINPVSQNQTGLKTIKGGNWNSQAFETNIDIRTPYKPMNASNYIGFRVLKPVN